MKKRLDYQVSVNFTDTQYEKIRNAAKAFDVSCAEVVRECVNRELDRLIDREKKRIKAQRKA